MTSSVDRLALTNRILVHVRFKAQVTFHLQNIALLGQSLN